MSRWAPLLILAVGVAAGCATAPMERASQPERRGLFAVLGDGRAPSSAIREAREADEAARQGTAVAPAYRLGWPLAAISVTSPFGARARDFHEGVDLRAPRGTPVFAAQTGQVIYAGSRIRGYGRMVVIKGADNVSTVYAHNSRLFVRQGMRVREGQKIALSGNTGHSTGPHLHFEVRQGTRPQDPLAWLDSQPHRPRTSVARAKPAKPQKTDRRLASRKATGR